MREEAGDPVSRQADAYNRRELEAFLACYSPDTVIEDATGKVLMRGHDAMRRAYGELFRDSPRIHTEITTRIRVGDYVVDEEQVTGWRESSEPISVVAVYHVAGDVIDHVRFIR